VGYISWIGLMLLGYLLIPGFQGTYMVFVVGMVVEISGMKGNIIGHNRSCNLDVLFQEDKWKGRMLNCHPTGLVVKGPNNGEFVDMSAR
jgi:hypothetical protein